MGVTNKVEKALLKSDIRKDYHDIVISVSLLHDILEDTDCTEDYIRDSFGDLVADAVVAISKVKGEEYLHYLERVVANPIAKFVKVQDIKFNKEQVKICIEKGEDLDKMLNLFKKYNRAEYYLGVNSGE